MSVPQLSQPGPLMSSLGDGLIPLVPTQCTKGLSESCHTEHSLLLRLVWAEMLEELLFSLKADTATMDSPFCFEDVFFVCLFKLCVCICLQRGQKAVLGPPQQK